MRKFSVLPQLSLASLGLVELVWGAATAAVPYDRRPWEREANLLAGSLP